MASVNPRSTHAYRGAKKKMEGQEGSGERSINNSYRTYDLRMNYPVTLRSYLSHISSGTFLVRPVDAAMRGPAAASPSSFAIYQAGSFFLVATLREVR